MADLTLSGRVILVVEDEYLLAQDLCAELASKEAIVLGPVATIEQGLTLVREADQLSGAVLDINLRGEPVYALADELLARSVPFIFTTGYGSSSIPARFAHVTRCEKPARVDQVIEALGRAAPA